MDDEASYICDSCGEEIVVPIDLTAGHSQDYVEDCPVCCNPNLIHVEIMKMVMPVSGRNPSRTIKPRDI